MSNCPHDDDLASRDYRVPSVPLRGNAFFDVPFTNLVGVAVGLSDADWLELPQRAIEPSWTGYHRYAVDLSARGYPDFLRSTLKWSIKERCTVWGFILFDAGGQAALMYNAVSGGPRTMDPGEILEWKPAP